MLIARSDRIREVLGWTPHYDDLDVIAESALAWELALS
jgi:UDP-glucose 4-epimerase